VDDAGIIIKGQCCKDLTGCVNFATLGIAYIVMNIPAASLMLYGGGTFIVNIRNNDPRAFSNKNVLCTQIHLCSAGDSDLSEDAHRLARQAPPLGLCRLFEDSRIIGCGVSSSFAVSDFFYRARRFFQSAFWQR
jgi:hypothetical protein